LWGTGCGVLGGPVDTVEARLELTPVEVGELAERVLVAGARTDEGLVGHARILAPSLPSTFITSTDVAVVRNSPLSSRPRERLNEQSRRTRGLRRPGRRLPTDDERGGTKWGRSQ